MAETQVARLDCDEATAQRVVTLLGETLPEDVAVSAFEKDDGQWAVAVHFGDGFPKERLQELTREAAGSDVAGQLQFETVAEHDWIKTSLDGLPIVQAGRFVVHGAHHRQQIPANAIGIQIEAALAFGTGHHGTTRGCLLALDALLKGTPRKSRHPKMLDKRAEPRGATANAVNQPTDHRSRLPRFEDNGLKVLDVGTGTGVLAIAGAKALRRKVCAADIDPIAAATAKSNARHNAVGSLVTFQVADAARALPWRGPFDLIFANILLGPLTKMARPLTQRLARRGHIVLSGLTSDQANAARAAYAAQGLALKRRLMLDGWLTLVMTR